MSNRKESLKKSLGITEYPWSSDDDENDTVPTIPVAPQRRPTESEINNNNLSEMAGSSAQSHVASTQSTSRRDRDQTRQDRDFFWSLLNKPRGSTVSLPRTSSRPDVPLSYLVSSRPTSHGSGLALPLSLVSRPGHSAVDARASPDLSSPSAVLRFLNLRKFNRSHRPSRSTTNMYPTVSGTAGRVFSMPEPQSRSASASDVTELIRSRSRRTQSRHGIQESGRNISLNDSSTEEAPASPSILRNPASTSGEMDLSVRSTVEPVHIDQSDDEADVSVPSGPPPTARDEDMVDGDAVAEVHVTLSPEEEVVEIDAEPETIVVGDVSAVNIQNGDDNAPVEETPQASTAAEDGQQQPHGVKRKRDAIEDNEPHSVKEFNQSLLRLLECPVCLEWMEPPMSQCRRGHLVCGRCRARLATCPVCRTAFSSVRNRAMEGVAEMLRYPCRHGCGREVRLRRRAPHEASCGARRYRCPAPACAERAPLPHHDLAKHFQSKHLPLLKIGRKHKFSLKVNAEQHDNWLIMALQELFHLRIDVDIRTWGVIVYVAYIGPKCMAKNYTYEVTCVSQHNSRKLVYTRATHCDLESSSLNVSRQDCFHLTLDQALNFLRVKNRYCEPDKFLNFTVDITKIEVDASRDDSDS